MTKFCIMCGAAFKVTGRSHKYCGSQKDRTGCADEISRLHTYRLLVQPQQIKHQNDYYKKWYKKYGRPDRSGRAYLAASK